MGSSVPKYSCKVLLQKCNTFLQVNKLKREVAHMKQELQYKEHGFQTLKK